MGDQKVIMAIMIKYLETHKVDHMDPGYPVLMNSHVKYPIFSTKDAEDAESHLLHSNDWIDLQRIAIETKCVMFLYPRW